MRCNESMEKQIVQLYTSNGQTLVWGREGRMRNVQLGAILGEERDISGVLSEYR